MKKVLKERKEREERIHKLWRGAIKRLAFYGIQVELKHDKFMDTFSLHGSFVGREKDDAIVYQFIQELDTKVREDVDKINFIRELLINARALSLQEPVYIQYEEESTDD